MGEIMNFPETPFEFLKAYEFKDIEEIYTNGSMLIPSFRVKQMIEYYFNSTSTSDVQKVRHGKWIKEHIGNGVTRYKCSVCNSCFGEDMIIDFNHNKFCADCGAKIDKI